MTSSQKELIIEHLKQKLGDHIVNAVTYGRPLDKKLKNDLVFKKHMKQAYFVSNMIDALS